MKPATTARTSVSPSTSPTLASSRQRFGRRRPQEILDEKIALARSYPVHVGVDTGKTFHVLVARGPDGRRTKALRVEVSRESFDAADAFLTKTFTGYRRDQMMIGLEFAGHHGLTFAHYLQRKGYHVVNVLPSVTKRLKEVEDNSPRKDDVKDAAQICTLLASGYFVAFTPLAETEAELRILTSEREVLTREETRIKNRLQAVLDVVWPEFAGEFCNLDKVTPRVLLSRWPVAADLAAAPARSVYHAAREASRNQYKTEQVRHLLGLAKTSVAITHGLEARRAEIKRLLHRWDVLRAQMALIDGRLFDLVSAHRAAAALITVPGVSYVCAATIVSELGNPDSYESPRQVLKLAGMNLAGKSSGTSVRGRVKQTKRGRPALRRQLFLLAGRWCQKRGYYRSYYLELRQRTGSKTSAMCAVARKLVPMLLHIMQTGRAFDLATWERARHASVSSDNPYREVDD